MIRLVLILCLALGACGIKGDPEPALPTDRVPEG
ncbi:lipoprotein [Amaricoccus sp.]|nr:lipoprotein [uncultured Amaricoccus sp.]